MVLEAQVKMMLLIIVPANSGGGGGGAVTDILRATLTGSSGGKGIVVVDYKF